MTMDVDYISAGGSFGAPGTHGLVLIYLASGVDSDAPVDQSRTDTNYTAPVCGVPSGNIKRLNCPKGTHIVSMYGKFRSIIDSFNVKCSNGATLSKVGGDGGYAGYEFNCPAGFYSGDITVTYAHWWSDDVIVHISAYCQGYYLGSSGSGDGYVENPKTVNVITPDNSFVLTSVDATAGRFLGSLKFTFSSHYAMHAPTTSPSPPPTSVPTAVVPTSTISTMRNRD